MKKDAVKTSTSTSLPAAAAAAGPSVVDEGEMNTLLSQYLPRPADNMATGTQPRPILSTESYSVILKSRRPHILIMP